MNKPSVARVIVRAIKNGDPTGRFLKKDSATGKWFEIGDKKAAEKTSQALRERTEEEKGGAKSPDLTSENAGTVKKEREATTGDMPITAVITESVVAAAAAVAATTAVDAALGESVASILSSDTRERSKKKEKSYGKREKQSAHEVDICSEFEKGAESKCRSVTEQGEEE